MQRTWTWLALVLGAVSVPTSARGDLLIVGPSSVGGTYTSIQPAVDAAHDGDVILVHTTDQSAFTVDGKGLSVVEWPGHDIALLGTITVRNVPLGKTVLLDGVFTRGSSVYPKSHPALLLQNNAGPIRIQDGSFFGGGGAKWSCVYGHGGEAVVVENSPKVLLQGCKIFGGGGGGDLFSGCVGGDGGDGVVSSGSALAIYDCQITGGAGGPADDGYPFDPGGDGGDGVHATTWGVFLSGCTVRGGLGGHGSDGGDGGCGFVLDMAQGRILETVLLGGAPGTGSISNGLPGSPTAGSGLFFMLPEDCVRLDAISVSADHVAMQVLGEPAATVWLFSSRRVDQRFLEGLSGIATFPANTWTTMQPVGTIPATGRLQLDVPILAPDGPGGTMWIQALTRPAVGDPVLSSPRAVTTLATPLPPG